MKILLLIGLVILLLIAVCVTLWQCPHVLRRFSSAVIHEKYAPAADIKFRSNGIQGYNSQGPRGSTSDGAVVKSSDCVTVAWTIYRFPTEGDAEAQFYDWIKSASKVVETTDSDEASHIQRAVLEIDDKEASRHSFNIVSKKKTSKVIVSIWSKSLGHALLLEKQWKEKFADSEAQATPNHREIGSSLPNRR